MLIPGFSFTAVHMAIAVALPRFSHQYPRVPLFVLFSDSTHIPWRWRLIGFPALRLSSSEHFIPFIIIKSFVYQAMALNRTIYAVPRATCP